MQNGLGVTAAGALGGFAVLQGRSSKDVESDLKTKLRQEQNQMKILRKQVGHLSRRRKSCSACFKPMPWVHGAFCS